jgi:HD-GYP domain-containing protein (c-di-GMP phosphodiesterase class II)
LRNESILIALSKTEVREILVFAVESKTGRKPYEAATARQAIEFLAEHGAVKIVICEYPGISDVLFRHIISLNRKRPASDQIQCIVCCGQEPEGDVVLQRMNVLGYASWANLIDSTLSILEPPPPVEEVERPVPASDKDLVDVDMCRIKTSLLIRVGVMRASVYIRLSATKFVKMFQEGDEFVEDDYTRILKDKGLSYLSLRRNECSEFLLKFKTDLLKLLEAEFLTPDVQPDLLEEIHETAQELLLKIGPTPEVQAVVKANVQLAVKAMGSNPRLSDILKRLEIDREKYIASHSVLLPQIACTLAMSMDWKSDATLQKLALAAFLHDIPLTNHALAAIQDLTEMTRRKDQFSADELKAYKTHPARASELAKRFQEIPPDVDTIILQHHERADGSGFPRSLVHHQISPLAAVFIVAHDIVSAIFDSSTPFTIDRFVESTKERYHAGNFRKLHAQLSSLKF